DPRDPHRAVRLPRPLLHAPNPAGAVLVHLPVAIPVELDADAPVRVGTDVVLAPTDDDRALDAVDARLRGGARRPIRGFREHAAERLLVVDRALALAAVLPALVSDARVSATVDHVDEEVVGVEPALRVSEQPEDAARGEPERRAVT